MDPDYWKPFTLSSFDLFRCIILPYASNESLRDRVGDVQCVRMLPSVRYLVLYRCGAHGFRCSTYLAIVERTARDGTQLNSYVAAHRCVRCIDCDVDVCVCYVVRFNQRSTQILTSLLGHYHLVQR